MKKACFWVLFVATVFSAFVKCYADYDKVPRMIFWSVLVVLFGVSVVGLLSEYKLLPWSKKTKVTSPDYQGQWNALNELSLAYQFARWDFIVPVLKIAFDDPPPKKSQCVWPPPGITKDRADFLLRRIWDWLQERRSKILAVAREVNKAQVGLGASGFNVPPSYIVVDPLGAFVASIKRACHITEVVKSAIDMDAALENALNEISVGLILLKGQIAKPSATIPT
jgi:hypothetical protein